MKIVRRAAAIDLSPVGRIGLIVDPGTDVASRAALIVFVRQLLEAAPLGSLGGVWVFGSEARMEPRTFVEDGQRWLAANASRARILRPALRGLRAAECTSAILVAAEPVYDWEDWQDDLVRLRAKHLNAPVGGGHVYQQLHDPIEALLVDGLCFPLGWDLTEPFEPEQLAGWWRIPVGTATDRVTLQILGPSGETGAIRLQRRSGDSACPTRLVDIEDGGAAPAWRTLSEADANRFRCAMDGLSYKMDGEDIKPKQVTYQGTGLFPKLVYESVEPGQATRFVILRRERQELRCRLHDSAVLHLGQGRVAWNPRASSRTRGIYQLPHGQAQWQRCGELAQYEKTEDGHVIHL